MLDMAVSPLSYVAVADSELLDTVVAAPRSFVAVVYMTMPALSLLLNTVEGVFLLLPQRHLLCFLWRLEWYDASGSGTAESAFSAYLSLAPLL